MTVTIVPRRIFEIPCSARGCKAWTSDHAPSTDWVTAQAAVRAAIVLGWIHVLDEETGRHVWICPKHQTWDPARSRWVRA